LKNTNKNLNNIYIDTICQILYNLDMKARTIKKSYISCTGYFASYKNKTQIAFESTLERDFYMTLEFDENVIKYEEQPMRMYYKYLDGNKRRYTPDTLVTYIDGTQKLFEVKYFSELENNDELQNKIKILKKYIRDTYNVEFCIFTDKNIEDSYLYNLKFLYKFVFIHPDINKINEIKKLIKIQRMLTVRELLDGITDNKYLQLEYLPYVWNYIFDNLHMVNIHQKLTMKTAIIYKGYRNG